MRGIDLIDCVMNIDNFEIDKICRMFVGHAWCVACAPDRILTGQGDWKRIHSSLSKFARRCRMYTLT